ncbi:MAG: large conductance mechanosensitive channel protein MscL [Actinomycetes bacterium]
MLKGFKDFIMRGNVIDLAVAVVVGAAFTALIAAFTEALIKPAINLILGGGIHGGEITINGQVFNFGLLVNAVIAFVITAAVVYFIFVLPMNKFRDRFGKVKDEKVSEEIAVLREIRDELRANREQ